MHTRVTYCTMQRSKKINDMKLLRISAIIPHAYKRSELAYIRNYSSSEITQRKFIPSLLI